jgi:hypothetical protein
LAPICPPLKLRNGTSFPDPVHEWIEFIERDGSYRFYDLVPVEQDNTLTEHDIRMANRLFGRMPTAIVNQTLVRRGTVGAVLSRIPPDASLTEPEDSIPWRPLQELFRVFEGIHGLRLPRLTKFLHRKRPALIPILDSVVIAYLEGLEGRGWGGLADRGIELTRAYKRELDHCLAALKCVRQTLLSRGTDLTECRLLDFYVWAYSGQYEPLWRRGAIPISASSSDQSNQRRRDPTLRVQVFIDAEDDYVRWLHDHPHGFVVNCHRNPRPMYLALHRAGCGSIGGRSGGRGNFTTRQYIKVCSDTISELSSWARAQVGGETHPCGLCHPEGRGVASSGRNHA